MNTKIKDLRKQRKISQEELALAAGTTRQTITSIEVGKYTASLVLAYGLWLIAHPAESVRHCNGNQPLVMVTIHLL